MDIYFLIFSSVFLFFIFVFFIVAFFGYYRKKQRNNQAEKEELKLSFRQEILQAQLEIQEQTMQNISQEIHDNIGQVLSLAKLHLATMDLSFDKLLEEKVQDSKYLVGKAIQDLRNLSHSMNTEYIHETGLPGALQYELELIAKSGSYETFFSAEGTPQKLDKQKELILFRIVQEVLNNIIKHAGAKKINVQVNYLAEQVEVIIADDGRGFDLTPVQQMENGTFGLGIKSMHNRAKLIGAIFNMQSTVGKGTTVTITILHATPKPELNG
jgi:two-component system NarL family sensor kinase